MPDMLVKLYKVKEDPALEARLAANGILLKRAIAPDIQRITGFVRENFGDGWANECLAGILRDGCWIAVKDKKVVGFACFEATRPNYFGPTGVLESMRGMGIGKALLLRSLLSLRERGYAYAIIGGVGPVAFYEKCVGARVIPDSTPGIYRDFLAAIKKGAMGTGEE